MSQEMKNYLTFKTAQYFRINGIEIKKEGVTSWMKDQLSNNGEILKGFILEAMAAGVK